MIPFSVSSLTGARLPHLTADLPDPPPELHLVGELPRGPSVALVGTRHPTPEALAFTAQLVSDFARAGYSIWSGGAEGIDGAAHRAALNCNARTVVVAPAGWGRPYPEAHVELFREIVARGGAYLSLVPEDRVALPHQFFARNALLVALSHATVVVQAPFRSGARNAAKHARLLGRPLFVVPSCPWVRQGVGCNLELGLGARPIGSAKEVIARLAAHGWHGVTTSPDEVATRTQASPEEDADVATAAPGGAPREATRGVAVPAPTNLRKRRARVLSESKHVANLESEFNRVLNEVQLGATTVDELCLRTDWSAAVVQSALLRLTLLGLLRVGRSGEIEIVSC